jgi:hypothetical protein
MSRLSKYAVAFVITAGGLGAALPVGAQGAPDAVQTLDRVTIFGTTSALEMGFNDVTVRNPDFTALTSTAQTKFTACQMSTASGLYCLDGGLLVRHWPDPKKSTTSDVPVSCADTALGLDTKKPDACTSITVDLAGNLWLAGRKGNGYSLFKITKKIGVNCADTAYFPLAGNYCAYEVASGRPLLLDLSPVDGEVGRLFDYGPGILGLEQTKTVTFFKDVLPRQAPIEVGSGKSAWGLSGTETLTGATILQRASANFTDSFAVVTTSNGRVLAKDVAANSIVFDTAYPIVANRPAGSTTCAGGLAGYQTRASSKSGRVYVTDKAVCQVNALVPTYLYTQTNAAPPSPAFTLTNAMGPTSTTDATPIRQTLSTRFGTTTVASDGISISPGISIDLTKCGGTACTLIPDSTDTNAFAGAQLSGVTLSGPGNMTLFQIRNIPDCRVVTLPICTPSTVVTDTSGRKWLNVTPLLPDEIIKLFPAGFGPAPDKLPPLLISPDNVGIASRNFRFDAFFGVTDPAIRFRNTFTAQFDISQLLSDTTRCGDTFATILDWDLMTTVSERYASVGGPTGTVSGATREHVDIITNTACFNPTSGSGTRWSLYTYGLQPKPGPIPARTYVDMMSKLYQDLYDTQTKLACASVDEGGLAPPANPPLSGTTCSQLLADLNNGLDKLNKCIQASTSPKTSAGDQNCTAFQSQLTGYQTDLNAAVRLGDDPANRIGELQARVQTLFHVNAHFLLSIPPGGFPPP